MLCRQKYNRAKEMLENRSVKEVAAFFNVSKEYIKAIKNPAVVEEPEVVEEPAEVKKPARRRRASATKVED